MLEPTARERCRTGWRAYAEVTPQIIHHTLCTQQFFQPLPQRRQRRSTGRDHANPSLIEIVSKSVCSRAGAWAETAISAPCSTASPSTAWRMIRRRVVNEIDQRQEIPPKGVVLGSGTGQGQTRPGGDKGGRRHRAQGRKEAGRGQWPGMAGSPPVKRLLGRNENVN